MTATTQTENLTPDLQPIVSGLSAAQKYLPTWLLYDAKGSEIFNAITELPEYYLTRCELEILQNHVTDISAQMGHPPFHFVEFGAGDSRKSRLLLAELVKQEQILSYVPVDISLTPLIHLKAKLKSELPNLVCAPLHAEYFAALGELRKNASDRLVIAFLGSNIGNLDPHSRERFLRTLHSYLKPQDQILIGFDLKKDVQLMHLAYNDRAKLTARFNLNVLSRLNHQLDADFKPDLFQHYGHYDIHKGAMVSYLLSRRSQQVHLRRLGQTISFLEFEAIHIEDSYKFTENEINRLALDNGFVPRSNWTDDRHWFLDALWEARTLQ